MQFRFISAFLFITFCSLSTSAQAWYIDYSISPGSDMYYEDSFDVNPSATKVTYLQVSDDVGYSTDAGWEYDEGTDDGFGGVDVSYIENWGDRDTPQKSTQVMFRIVSDYGNLAQTSIDLEVTGEIVVDSHAYEMGYGVGADASAEGTVTNDMGAPAIVGGDDIITLLSLFTNTDYTFEAVLGAEVWAELFELPPDHFDSWAEHDDFFDSEGYGAEVSAEASAGLFYEIVIDGAETPVPEPATMLLFGFGILGLAGLRAAKKN